MSERAASIGAAMVSALAVFACVQLLLRPARPAHVRPNYRGRAVVATGGIVLVGPLLIGVAALLLIGDLGKPPAATAAAGIAVAILGLVDDVYGDRHAGGLIGHTRELFRGRVTTGALKAVGGAVVGLVAAWFLGERGVWIVAGGAVIALSANLANLLDLRPGRTLKVWFLGAITLVVAGVADGAAVMLFAIGGGVLVFAVFELGERLMLGDTGAGLLGAMLGVVAAASLGRTALLIALGALIALTLVSEVSSFTKVIEGVRPLRWLDQLGRKD